MGSEMCIRDSVVSWDTSERFKVVDATSFTTVISGGPGIDVLVDRNTLPNEVNLITDAENALWYSTKGWYRAIFYETSQRRAPTIVMTLTTDTMGNSRIDYAVITDQLAGGNGPEVVDLEVEQ